MSDPHTFGRDTLDEFHPEAVVTRPTACPSCQGRRIDTFAKVITAATSWRCRECDHTWTLAAARYPAR